RYITTLNSKGAFTFHNLPSGTFYVYALKDDSKTYRYTNNKVAFAFADSPIVVRPGVPSVTLYAYVAVKGSTTTPTGNAANQKASASDKRLKFQTSLKNGRAQDLLQPFSFIFDRPLKRFDSSKVSLSADSTYNPVTDYS